MRLAAEALGGLGAGFLELSFAQLPGDFLGEIAGGAAQEEPVREAAEQGLGGLAAISVDQLAVILNGGDNRDVALAQPRHRILETADRADRVQLVDDDPGLVRVRLMGALETGEHQHIHPGSDGGAGNTLVPVHIGQPQPARRAVSRPGLRRRGKDAKAS